MTQEKENLKEPDKSCKNDLHAYSISSYDKQYGKHHAKTDLKPEIAQNLEGMKTYQALIPGTDAFLSIGSTPETFNQFKTIKVKIGYKEHNLTKEDFKTHGTDIPRD